MKHSFLLFALLVLALCGCGGKTILQDNFSAENKDLWQLEEDAYGRSVIADGRLIIQVNEPNKMQFATLRKLTPDFLMNVEGMILAGSPNSSYGVLFRLQDGGAFYRFDITGNGSYIIEKRTANGEWQRLTDTQNWKKSPAIRTGLNAINKLQVNGKGSTMTFSVNDVLLERYEGFDNSYGSGMLALDAGTFALGGLQVAFDNVVLREP